MVRPIITNGKTGIGNFGVGVMPDGTSDTLRILIKPDGFHFVPSDFEDLVLPSIVFDTPDGSKYNVSFNNDGKLLINGNELVLPTNQEDEVIGGNKTHTGLIKLEGGLQLSANEKLYEISVDEEGNLKASEVKE
ncbi:hypothetical protein PWO95_06520 [Weissella paramesenteroides]|uniref:hypothetical protein n=1 Tax=Weissella paramesenteroides TaxID=1249 RepID=UPI0023A9359F|nr:hypothetical protein [Weissella paramesenteroides]WEA52294.1 hypothetical protein PWO95_06520 [Weissella paramesenteroides]